MAEVLRALDYSHEHGIMHRDIKPQNIIVDHKSKKLKVIDWGLAEFYHINQDYNVRVASRPYKGPELLVEDRFYDYSLDIWSVGAMFGGILFKKDTLFLGEDNDDQLIEILKVLGTDKFLAYLAKYNLNLDSKMKSRIEKWPQKPWGSFINKENQNLCSPEALDLLDKMLLYDRSERITPRDALNHDYFKSV